MNQPRNDDPSSRPPVAPTRRKIGGRLVNPVGYGCMSLSWGYSGKPDDSECERLLGRALDLGYDHLDTARIYGLGHNEERIGKALKGRRQEFYLASKTGIRIDKADRSIDCRPETIRAALEESLRLLQTDHIDLYYLHRRDFTVPIEDSVGALAELVAEGKIGGIGLSEMSADTLRRAHAVHPITAMQTEYSPWTRNPEIAVLAACAELGTSFVAFSPGGRGALANSSLAPDRLEKADLRKGMPRFQGENWSANLRLIQQLEEIARDNGVTLAQLSLGWVLSRGAHVLAIPGTAKEPHLEENIARWDWAIPADTVKQVDAVMNQDSVQGHRYSEAMRVPIDTEEYA